MPSATDFDLRLSNAMCRLSNVVESTLTDTEWSEFVMNFHSRFLLCAVKNRVSFVSLSAHIDKIGNRHLPLAAKWYQCQGSRGTQYFKAAPEGRHGGGFSDQGPFSSACTGNLSASLMMSDICYNRSQMASTGLCWYLFKYTIWKYL